MSGSNAKAPPLPEITLDELERLIRILGMLGSGFDGEILNAAKLAVRWVAEHQTDWRTLLTPEPEPGVTGVAAVADADALERTFEAERVQAYANGYQAGLRAMAQQVKAQASYAGMSYGGRQAPHPSGQATSQSASGSFNPTVGGLGAGLGGSGAQRTYGQAAAAQAAQAAPAGSGGGAGTSPGKVWPTGSWQAVAQTLLDRDAQGIPGIFRGAPGREQTFVTDILTRGFPTLTAAQETWLRDIAGRNGLSW